MKMETQKKNTKKYDQNYPGMLMVVDGSNLAYRAYHKFKNLSTKSDEKVGLVYGFLRVLQSYLVRFRPSYLVVVFDTKQSKQSNFRAKILKTYKIHREEDQVRGSYIDFLDFNKQQRILRKMLNKLGVSIIIDKKGLGHEADDYIAYCVLNHKKHSLIISSDKDFCQLITSGVRVFNPNKEKIISVGNCKEVMGYEPHECIQYLSILGDKSDDIPGYKGMGPVKTSEFLNQFGSIEKFLSDKSNKYSGIDHEALEFLWERNKSLVDIKYGLDTHPIEKVPIKYSEFNKHNITLSLNYYEMYSMMKEEFLEPFKQLKPWRL